MSADPIFDAYVERAKGATSSERRTVCMLGMMCATVIRGDGGFIAFVGEGYGGNWPDPRESAGSPDGEARIYCPPPKR